jgi:antitoxin component YwqK of YwqJK toxin-antitoxin module
MKLNHLFVFILTTCVLCSCRKDVPQINYYPNGNVKETCYLRNGKLSGKYKSFYENGNLYGEGEYRHNHPVGVWRTYYPNGKIMVIESYGRKGKHTNVNAWDENGKQVIKDGTGTFIKYYPDGSLQSITNYKDCLFDGANEAWFPNGIKESEFYYKNGRPTGTWRFWDLNGNLYKTEEY